MGLIGDEGGGRKKRRKRRRGRGERGEERKIEEEEKQGREKGPRKMEIRMALGKPGGAAAGHVLFPGRPWAVGWMDLHCSRECALCL